MTSLELLGLGATFVTALAALITALIKGRSARYSDRVASAEANKIIADGQSVVIANLCTEVERLSRRVDQLEQEYALLQRKYDHVLGWAMPRGYKPPASW